jgi:four helix bundle protein
MPTIKSFEDLKVWKDSRIFVKEIYTMINNFPVKENYGLTSQITRAAVSIMSNIAEGFARESNKEFIRFLIIARGSTAEVQSDLFIALDLGYINQDEFQKNYCKAENLGKQINGLIKYLKANVKINIQKNKISEACESYESAN